MTDKILENLDHLYYCHVHFDLHLYTHFHTDKYGHTLIPTLNLTLTNPSTIPHTVSLISSTKSHTSFLDITFQCRILWQNVFMSPCIHQRITMADTLPITTLYKGTVYWQQVYVNVVINGTTCSPIQMSLILKIV